MGHRSDASSATSPHGTSPLGCVQSRPVSAVDRETVRGLSRLARLDLSEEELGRFVPELERILAAFEVLARHAPPAAPSATASSSPPAPSSPRTREDTPAPSLDRKELLGATRHGQDGFFVVPKTVRDAQ